nr:MAG TPA: hypothetical protein [Caudoviricetes sp.]
MPFSFALFLWFLAVRDVLGRLCPPFRDEHRYPPQNLKEEGS